MHPGLDLIVKNNAGKISRVITVLFFPASNKKDRAACKIGNVCEAASIFVHTAKNLGFYSEYSRFEKNGTYVSLIEDSLIDDKDL